MAKESHEQIVESLNMQIIMIYLEKLAQYVKKIPKVWNPKKVGPFGEANKVADESEKTKKETGVGGGGGLSLPMARKLSKMVT